MLPSLQQVVNLKIARNFVRLSLSGKKRKGEIDEAVVWSKGQGG